MVTSDEHGPSYPGDLICTEHSVIYGRVVLNYETVVGTIDSPRDMQGIFVPNQYGIIIASVRGVGTWKYVLLSDRLGWLPWMSCKPI